VTPKKKPAPHLRSSNDILRAKLRQNEQVFHLLVDSVREYAIFMLDPEGIVSTWNAGARRVKGYDDDEIIGQHFSRFYPPELPRDLIDAELDTTVRDGHFHDEGWRIRKDGSRFWADVTISPVRDHSGQLVGFAKVTRDMTAKREADTQRTVLVQEQAKRQAAENSDRMKDEFLSTLSHELRTPLNAILGWTNVMEHSRDDATITKGLSVVARNALMQNQLIADILDMQRLASGRLRLNVAPVDLAKVIEMALDTVQPSAHAKNIRLVPILDTTVAIPGDAERLQQVIWNLLSNAIKFTPKGGRVTLRLGRIDSQVDITIEDSGPGIDLEFLPYIFDRFRQFDASVTRRHGGLGLGLSIVRSLTELHGGTVSVGNAANGGAVFSIRLPVMTAHPVTYPESRPDGSADADKHVWLRSAPSLHGSKVLLVDDDADGREVVAQILDMCGAEVLLAASAAQGFPIVAHQRPDVIVCDVGMPEEDGYSFIQRVRALPVAEGGITPAAALTAFASTEDRMRALTAGFQIHVPKPVQPAELVTVVAALASYTRRV
jgi:PAS domain S-box-containing protein